MRLRIAALIAAALAVAICTPLLLAHADSSFDGPLFADTNADRASVCHESPFGLSASMAAIGQSRAQEIATTGNFTDRITPGVGAENIGWTQGTTDPTAAAAQINQAYLNSPPHTANICDRRWTLLGIGSVHVDQWNGMSNVWLDAEEFAGSAPSHPAPRPAAPSRSAPSGGNVSVPGVPSTGGAG